LLYPSSIFAKAYIVTIPVEEVRMRTIIATAWVAVVLVQAAGEQDLPSYAPSPDVSGTASSVGSDTLHPLMGRWAEKFRQYYPGVSLQIEGKGSNTAPPALLSGASQFAPMSRPMKPGETAEFEAKFGVAPTELHVAVDTLAVFVHRDNPVQSLSLEQVDALFSKVKRRGGKDLRTWGDLGLTGPWADKPINLYGRNSASGTYVFFKEHVLKNGDFKEQVQEQSGSAQVVQQLSADRYGIGYSGVGFATPEVRGVPLSEKAGAPAVAPTRENAYSGDYPLARFLYLYINHPPGKPLSGTVREFVRFVFSREGQEAVRREGFFPVPATVAREDLKKLD
jgi:phosphate transport system substrate-binding protein